MIFFEAYATIWEVEDRGKYANGKFSTSRKDKETGEYYNSSWFGNFFGKAYDIVTSSELPIRVKIKGKFDNEPYMKDGEKIYRKTPAIGIWDVEIQDDYQGGGFDTPPTEVRSSDLPF